MPRSAVAAGYISQSNFQAFAWVGRKGAHSAMHADNGHGGNWVHTLLGNKTWLFFPPHTRPAAFAPCTSPPGPPCTPSVPRPRVCLLLCLCARRLRDSFHVAHMAGAQNTVYSRIFDPRRVNATRFPDFTPEVWRGEPVS